MSFVLNSSRPASHQRVGSTAVQGYIMYICGIFFTNHPKDTIAGRCVCYS